ncbi:MAG TPA: hypothetical protein VGF79_11230, partial [Bacteroidia bacterium]
YRHLDTSAYISGDFVRNIYSKYRINSKAYLFDSLDQHCFKNYRLQSIRASGDSILYILHYGKSEPCQYVKSSRKITSYLDVWKYNKVTKKWVLHLGNLILNNREVCQKIDILKLTNFKYTLLNIESNWCVYGDYLIIPIKMPENVELEGDITPYYKKENFNGGLNLQILVFKLPNAVD